MTVTTKEMVQMHKALKEMEKKAWAAEWAFNVAADEAGLASVLDLCGCEPDDPLVVKVMALWDAQDSVADARQAFNAKSQEWCAAQRAAWQTKTASLTSV